MNRTIKSPLMNHFSQNELKYCPWNDANAKMLDCDHRFDNLVRMLQWTIVRVNKELANLARIKMKWSNSEHHLVSFNLMRSEINLIFWAPNEIFSFWFHFSKSILCLSIHGRLFVITEVNNATVIPQATSSLNPNADKSQASEDGQTSIYCPDLHCYRTMPCTKHSTMNSQPRVCEKRYEAK